MRFLSYCYGIWIDYPQSHQEGVIEECELTCELTVLWKEIWIDYPQSHQRRGDPNVRTFQRVAPELKLVPAAKSFWLGAPLSEEGISVPIREKREDLERLVSKLKILENHQAFILRKYCFALPKLQHIFPHLLRIVTWKTWRSQLQTSALLYGQVQYAVIRNPEAFLASKWVRCATKARSLCVQQAVSVLKIPDQPPPIIWTSLPRLGACFCFPTSLLSAKIKPPLPPFSLRSLKDISFR